MIAPSGSVVIENTTVLLTCVVYGNPLPATITWTRNNYTIYNYTDVTIYTDVIEVGGAEFLHSVLELCSVSEDDAGYYTCSANGSAGSDYESFRLIVQPLGMWVYYNIWCFKFLMLCCHVIFPSLLLPPFFPRSLNSFLPPSCYPSLHHFSSLFLPPSISLSSAPPSSPPPPHSVSLFLTTAPPEIVIAPPDTLIYEGNTVLFTCVAFGFPLPSLAWYGSQTGLLGNTTGGGRFSIYNETFNQTGIQFAMSVLEICDAEFTDEGQYGCVASSDSGYDSVYFNLTVEEPLGVWEL